MIEQKMRLTHHVLSAALFVALFVLMEQPFVASAKSENRADLITPIVAELYANPRAFVGKRITIYGLVVESAKSQGYFLLQDVSERPIRVIGAHPLPTRGDQIEVTGVVRASEKDIRIDARKIVHTQVLNGGGCC